MQEDMKYLVFGICVTLVLLSAFAGVASAGDKSVPYGKTAASGVKSDTWIEGHITEDTTWTLADSPYLVTGDVFVDVGVTLTIEPCVIVKFGGYMSLYVNGDLYAVGTDANKITFTSNKLSPERDDWNTIKFQGNESENFIMKHCIVGYAEYGVTIASKGSSIIEQCDIHNNTKGIYVFGENNAQIKNNIIKFNKVGLYNCNEYDQLSGIHITNNTIIENIDCGIYIYSHNDVNNYVYNLTINNNIVYLNKGHGIYLYAKTASEFNNIHSYIHNITINNNTIYSNNGSGIYIPIFTSAYYRDSYSYFHHIAINNNTIYSNNGPGIDIYVHNGIDYNAYVDTSYFYFYIYNISISNNIIFLNKNCGIQMQLFADIWQVYPSHFHFYIYNVTSNNNTIYSNDGSGIYIYAHADAYFADYLYLHIHDIEINYNTIYSNDGSGIYIYAYADTWYPDYYSSDIYNITINDNTVYLNSECGIYVDVDRSGYQFYFYIYNITINNNTVYLNSECGIYGYFNACFCVYSIKITNNNISWNEKAGIKVFSASHYEGLEFDITMHDNYIYSNNPGISISGGSKTHITNSSIHTNTLGVLYDRTTGNFASINNIYQNEWAMNVTNGATVKAEQNYWGDPSGPYHVSMNPEGKGNPVNGNGVDLDFIPFLTSPVEIGSPIASFIYSPQNPEVGEEITFDASSSYDPNGEIVSYQWDFEDGNVTSTTEKIIHHSYTAAGNYNVNLTVTDNEGLTNSTKEIIKISEPLTLGKLDFRQ